MADLQIVPIYAGIPASDRDAERSDTPVQVGPTHNNFLLHQLTADGARFARIYAFSYQGEFYDLPRPTIFLVHGNGIDPEGASVSAPGFASLSRMPADIGRTGLPGMAGSFAGRMRVWAYDRADFTVRMDVETGSFDATLLGAELAGGNWPAQAAGSVARAAGSVARSAGSVARASGSVARARRTSGGIDE
jgi:hypothetical protein